MRVFFKYLFWLLSLFTLMMFFLLSTQLGHKTLGHFFSQYLSNKTDNEIEVSSLNIDNYPKLLINMTINKTAQLSLIGTANRQSMEMNYDLKGNSFQWKDFKINTPLELKGRMKGLFTEIFVNGKGNIFDGKTEFSYIKTKSEFKNMKVILDEVKSVQLFKFLKLKPLLLGRMNVQSNFELFSKYEKRGKTTVQMSQGFMPSVAPHVPFELKTAIEFKDMNRKFSGEIDSEIGSLVVTDAQYHKSREVGEGKYDLKLKNLAYFETFLRHRYIGALNTTGIVHYENNKISLIGTTDKFDGELNYTYKDNSVDLDLVGVSLVKMLKQYRYPALLSANVYGNIDYDIKDRIVLIDTKLRETRFRETKMTNMVYDATGIDMLADVYDNSSFVAGYQNERLTSILKIDNGVNHLYLNDTVLNKKTNSIDSKFEVLMQGEELFGEIYGTLENPSVSIDMKRLLKYQINKKLGTFFGNEKAKKLKGGLKHLKNNAKKKASSFMNKFFH